MSAGSFLDACGFNPASSGTSNFVVSAAITGYQTPASAGAVNGTVYSYRAESSDKSQWEEGYGAYTVSSTTLARSTITANSSGGTSAINFTAAPNVFITALSADLLNASLFTSGTVATARLGSGTASSTTFLRGDQTWNTPLLNGVVAVNAYASTQTITIPTGATRANVTLWGGSGGNNGSGAGALRKYLTGLTPGNTLALTVGAAGSSSGTGAGGNSSLASGTQSITTLTANGGVGGTSPAAGTATNGDINVSGQKALNDPLASCLGTVQMPGMTGLGLSVGGAASAAGIVGGCIIEWLS